MLLWRFALRFFGRACDFNEAFVEFVPDLRAAA